MFTSLFHSVSFLASLTYFAQTGHVDAARLAAHADSLQVPVMAVWGVAWEETRSGVSGNAARGPGRERFDSVRTDYDSTGRFYAHVYTHKVCREIGRMQLNPCIDWAKLLQDSRCALTRIKASYDDNVYCGVKNLVRLHGKTTSWTSAVQGYNGGGPAAVDYRKRVEHYIGRVSLLSWS